MISGAAHQCSNQTIEAFLIEVSDVGSVWILLIDKCELKAGDNR